MWIILVWGISLICYLPLYFEQLGYSIPNELIQIKYLFVLVPILFTLICVKRRTSLKKWLKSLFAKNVRIESTVLCGIITFFGIFSTSILKNDAWDEMFLPFNTLYLLCMATIEEIAWRGFYLEYVLQKKTKKMAVLIVSLNWAIWHIPMWGIRNALSMHEIAFWLIYTIVVGNILGKCMLRYKNILVPIILHTIFNVCFLIPIKVRIIAILCIWIGVFIFEKINEKGEIRT